MSRAYYNEHDPYAAQWLRNLIDDGLIADGDVDERDIWDVYPSDVRGYTQCHFFAGLGGWSHALRLAGWPDDRPVWTGSCPCQPFSSAGKGRGFADERHLWPAFFHLIGECRPGVVMGEQVASKDGLAWLDLVQADLEGAGYASGAVDLCAAGVGAPHIRQRLYWVADASDVRRKRLRSVPGGHGKSDGWSLSRGTQRGATVESSGGCRVSDLANPDSNRLQGRADAIPREGAPDLRRRFADEGTAGGMGLADSAGRGPWRASAKNARHGDSALSTGGDGRPGPVNGVWRDADWLYCQDVKWRAVEPGTFPLAHGATARVGRLRAYGNAIVAPLAAEFIRAVMR